MTMESLGRLAEMAGGTVDAGWSDVAVDGIGTDTREDLTGCVFVALRGQRFDGHDHLEAAVSAGAVAVLAAHGSETPAGAPAVMVDDTRAALGRMAAAWRQTLPNLRVVAVTGTAGKTTTKDAIAAVCREERRTVASPRSFNNDIGVPLTILAARPEDEVLIAEVGTNAPGELRPLADMIRPDIAVVTLVGCGHLEGLGSLESVAREKYALLESLTERGIGFLWHQDLPVPRCRGTLQTFGLSAEADQTLGERGLGWMEFQHRRWATGLPGTHGALNAVAVILVAQALGLSAEAVERGLSHLQASPQRLSRCSVGATEIIDDSWNANPESMAATIETLPELVRGEGGVMLVLGDMLELGAASASHHCDLAPLLDTAVRRMPVRRIVLVGTEMGTLMAKLGGACGEVPVLHEPVADDESMARIAARVEPNETVLLKGSRGLALERIISAIESGAAAR